MVEKFHGETGRRMAETAAEPMANMRWSEGCPAGDRVPGGAVTGPPAPPKTAGLGEVFNCGQVNKRLIVLERSEAWQMTWNEE